MRLALLWVLSLTLSCNCGGDDDSVDAGRDAGADSGSDGAVDSGEDGGDGGEDAGADAGPGLIVRPDEREACSDNNPQRNLYFGDLHVHTRFSFDAASYDVRTGPRDAYRFAKGEAIDLPPYDDSSEATNMVQLQRPLDFAAVTDHAELMAATSLCTDESSPAADSPTCRSYWENNNPTLGFGDFFASIGAAVPQAVRYCRGNPAICAEELANVWNETIDAAEEHDDKTSSCEFTALIGYEWTGSAAGGGGQNLHRNVIFRGGTVLGRPVSFVDATTADQLWNALEANCLEAEGDCDVLAIPHNSNVGLGNMFNPVTEDGVEYDEAAARRRAELEPLVEIYQHKGSSECVTNVGDPLASEDELCDFEIFYENQCTEPGQEDCVPLCSEVSRRSSFLLGSTCVSASDYVRGALRRGLSEYVRVGVNPFQLGFIASTDTHSSIPGAVEEDGWPGHTGDFDDEPAEQLRIPESVAISVRTASPGGLAAVWAEENSRPSLFDAMRRRETYGTSGTRIAVRFFGGWGYADDICDDVDNVQTGYDEGVPMGGILPEPPSAEPPVFFVSALRDAMSAPLQRVQIIKGWVDPETGVTAERVFEVAGEPDNGASVDVATCEISNPSEDFGTLCGRWVDPEFDPSHPAFYYARVVENPTCRWSQRVCVQQSVDCSSPPDGPLGACCDGSIPQTIQERAWTSPIWYVP